MDEITALKSTQRSQALAARDALSVLLRSDYSNEICRRILSLPQVKNAGTIMSYMAFRSEADMSLLHDVLIASGIRLCFPVCDAGGHMDAYAADKEQWRYGRYGIKEPDPSTAKLIDPSDIDVLIVPCVGFDEKRNRIGWGAGYYDRYFQRCTDSFNIAAAFEVQKLPECAAGKFDCMLDAVATEIRLY